MKMSRNVRIVLLFGLFVLIAAAILMMKSGRAESHSASTSLPDLEDLKAINSVGPPEDPQLLFLLMTQYVNANRQGEGVEFFSARLKEFGAFDAGQGRFISASSVCCVRNMLRRCRCCADTATSRKRSRSSNKQSSYRAARFLL
jgi:hypothetical protein